MRQLQPRPPLVVSLVRRVIAFAVRLSLTGFRRLDADPLRMTMYRRIEAAVPRLVNSSAPRILSVSSSGYLSRLVGGPNASVQEANYPEHNILALPFEDESFDVVVTDQVLEHVEGDPFLAVEECRRVLKHGGLAVHTTPFLFQIHGYPSDFWRFTPDGLALMCAKHREVLISEGWGNRYLWMLNWLGILFDEKVPAAAWHPYHAIAVINEELFPVVTWVVARK